ncbi:MAG: UMP kinase [Parasporobacterium sp.]|nr:UMP kinase [Parasporobacterium sp.]
MKELKRIMLKLSGEALSKDGSYDEQEIKKIAEQVKTLRDKGIDVAIVIGGGNYWRGRTGVEIDRPKSDSIGMLATVMNCIYVSEHFRYAGMKTAIMTPFICGTFTELFSKDKANEYFAEGRVVFFAGGTGHPYFTTDTTVVLRAIEINADCILAAKAVDGVYDSDPNVNPDAKKFDRLTFEEIVDKKLQVIDLTASIMSMENKMPMRLFKLDAPNSIINALGDNFTGTEITVE